MTDWSKELADLARRQALPCGYGKGLNFDVARGLDCSHSNSDSRPFRTDPLNFGDTDAFGNWGYIVRAYEDKDNAHDLSAHWSGS